MAEKGKGTGLGRAKYSRKYWNRYSRIWKRIEEKNFVCDLPKEAARGKKVNENYTLD